MDITRQSAYLVVNPITVYNYVFLFKYMMAGQTSDSMTAQALRFNWLVGV